VQKHNKSRLQGRSAPGPLNSGPSLKRYSASEICFRLEADIDGIGIQTVGWTIK
jgi:hypothetical protein